MSAEKIQGVYQKLVYWVADTAPADWREVHINMEVLADNAEASNSWVIRSFIGDDKTKVEYPARGAQKLDMRDLFLELNDLSAEFGDRWTVCDFTVTSDGKYKVDYAHGEPPRLSGKLATGT